jgi:hypothetical protein
MRIAAITSIALLAGTTAFAQDEPARRAAVEVAAAARVPLEKAMTGAPYSADTLVEGVQTLADGNRIVRRTTGHVYRDGAGRTRREEEVAIRSVAATGATQSSRTTIAIVDPVGGYSYSLDPVRKIAWRTPIGAGSAIMEKVDAAKDVTAAGELKARTDAVNDKMDKMVEERRAIEVQGGAMAGGGGGRGGAFGPGGGAVAVRGRGQGYASTPGPLERKTLEGVTVEGRKTTTVIPAGQVGNEQPLTIVSEEWRSLELGVLVLTRHSDPRTGESTYRLTNIVRAEPDQSLFMVPSDYEIRETGIRRMLEAKK